VRTNLVLAAALLFTGCSSKPAAAPVEPEKARETLRAALDAWKAGRPIDALKNDTPPIVAQDFDWMAGARLTEYAVVGDGTPLDANLRVQVNLTLRTAQGAAATKTVYYVVGTDKTLTVFRAME
jgi:hypothetical protein